MFFQLSHAKDNSSLKNNKITHFVPSIPLILIVCFYFIIENDNNRLIGNFYVPNEIIILYFLEIGREHICQQNLQSLKTEYGTICFI